MGNQRPLYITLHRYVEMLFSCFTVSTFLRLFFLRGHLKGTPSVQWVASMAGLAVYVVLSVVLMRRCRFVLGEKSRLYYSSNLVAWGLFCGTGAGVLALFGARSSAFGYLFMLARIWSLLSLNGWGCLGILCLITLALIFLSQIGMKPILREAEEELNARYH